MRQTVAALAIAFGLLMFIGAPAHANKGCADVHKDNVVDSLDALVILQFDAGLFDPGLILLNQWDPYDDNVIDSRDALLVLQYDAGIIDALYCYGPPPTPTSLPI